MADAGDVDLVPDAVSSGDDVPERDELVRLTDEAEEDFRTVASAKIESYRGPLPQPEAMREYESALPGAADRILSMAERQAAHRIDIENRALELEHLGVTSAFARANRGLNLGALVAVVIVAGGAFMAFLGYPEAGGGVIGGTIVGLAATFVYGARSQNRARESSDEDDDTEQG